MAANRELFPADFCWGAATAAYQIEGAAEEDGKGESIWDRFCTVPGAIVDGSSGKLACDHYHRWQNDVNLMWEMGLNAYRFSVSWPRILPDGRGTVNRRGLDFYDRLVDALLEAGIEPYVTLYHWDLPQALQDAGGWPARDTAYHFADYAKIVVQRLGDRVSHWITHNEPGVAAYLGYHLGYHAPGVRNLRAAAATVHHLLLSHGLALSAIRALNPRLKAGITLNLSPVHPASDRREDEEAAAHYQAFQFGMFLDPLFKGRYPDELAALKDEYEVDVRPGDMEIISAPFDFLGVNYYTRNIIHRDPVAPPVYASEIKPGGVEYTEMGWEVYPDGLRELLVWLNEKYKAPAYYITENGAAFPDLLLPDHKVHDTRRVAYLESHIGAIGEAIAAGVPLKGYFVWSLMDNFEWGFGFTKRFGLLYTDYATEDRIWKDSALWYRDWIRG